MSEEQLPLRIVELEREVHQLRSKLAQDASLSVRERLLNEAEKIAHLGSWMWVLQTNEVFWSDEFFRILGLDPAVDQATPGGFFSAIHPEDIARVTRLTEKSLASGNVERIEFRIVTPKGEVRDIVMDGAFLFDAQGTITRMVGCCLDVTERRRSEDEVRASRTLLDLAKQLSGVGVFLYRRSDDYVQWSPEVYRVFGTTVPLSPQDFDTVIELEDREAVRLMQRKVRDEGQAGPIAFRIRRPDGAIRHLLMSAQRYGADGIAGSIIDISERIEAETRLRQSQKMEALGRLAGGVAHDFNNLLTVILGGASMLQEQMPDNVEVTEILSAATQASDVTRQLLAFSRDSVTRRVLIDLDRVIEKSLNLLRRMIGEEIALVHTTQPGLWPLVGDAAHVNQILMNLVVNARDALGKRGTIRIETRNCATAEATPAGEIAQREWIELVVADDGAGMSASAKARAFEPFFTTKAGRRGTGLGLAMVFSLVAQHGGVIELDSDLGRGTRVIIRWPRADMSRVTVDDDAPSSEPSSPAAGGVTRRPAGARILVVEDEPAVRRFVVSALSSAGYVPEAVSTVRAALAANPSEFELTLTDVVLPDGNGVEVARELRRREPGARILYMSGHAANSGGQLDAPFLPKPFTASQLCEAVRRSLAESHS